MRNRDFLSGVIMGLLLFGVFAAAAIAITVRIPVALNDPPVSYSNIVPSAFGTVCAGDTLTFTADVKIDRAAVIQTYTSIRSVDTGENMPNAQSQTATRIHPVPVEFPATITFTVPSALGPGLYQHVRSTIALNMDTEPSFLTIPFSVVPCP